MYRRIESYLFKRLIPSFVIYLLQMRIRFEAPSISSLYNVIGNAMQGRLEKRSRLDETTYHKCQGAIIYNVAVPLGSHRVFVRVNCNLQNDNAVTLSLGNAIIPSTSGKVSIFSPRVLNMRLNNSIK